LALFAAKSWSTGYPSGVRPYQYFYDRVYMDPNSGCWIWLQALNPQGYAICRLGKETKAHRAAYRSFRGDIPDGRELHHVCRNKACVNPDHLKALTDAEHAAEEGWKYQKFAAKEFCKNGHPRNPENLYVAPKSDRGGNKMRRDCKVCGRIRTAKYKARIKRLEAVAP
jgi:hypothetical protein